MVSYQGSNSDLDSFRIHCHIGKFTIPGLLDSGARVGCMSSTLHQKLKHLGKSKTYTGIQVYNASGSPMHVSTSFTVDIDLGDKTTIKGVQFLIFEDLNTDLILGVPTLTLLKEEIGYYCGKFWHHSSCRTKKGPVAMNCSNQCREISSCIVLNPFHEDNFDFLEMIEQDQITNNVISRIDKLDDVIRTFKINQSPVRTKFVASEYVELQPFESKIIPVDVVQERITAGQKSTFVNKIDRPLEVIAEPTGKCVTLGLMTDKDAAIVSTSTPGFPVTNYSDSVFCIHKGYDICQLNSVQPGKLIRARDLKDLGAYDEKNMKNIISEKVPVGISFPEKCRPRFDNSYEKTLAGQMGESVPTESEQSSSDAPHIEFYHVDSNGSKHLIKMECHLTGKYKERFRSHCIKHSKVFFKDPENVPYLVDENEKPIKARIGIRSDAVLKYHKPIPLSPAHRAACEEHINKKIRNKTLIKIPRQSWSSQVLVVPKNKPNADGSVSYRFVQSLINLNKNCLFKQFTLEKPRHLLQKLPQNAKFYNFFDAADSFDSILIDEKDRAYTAFEVPKQNGGTEFVANTRIPQGALNSSGTLVETYRKLFKDEFEACNCINYVDDFVNADVSINGLLRKTIKLITKFDKVNLTLSPEKCRWFVTSGVFCNMKIQAGTTTIPEKYAAKINDMVKPHNTSTLQTFLGLVCFSKQYIDKYGENVALLTDVLHSEKTKTGWAWGPDQDRAFEHLKKAVLSPKTLHLFDENAKNSEVHVFTDASDRAYGIVLLQRTVDEDGKADFKLIDMVSKIIHKSNRNVSILRKEFNSLILSMDYFHHIFINPDVKKIFWVDSKALFLLSKNEGRSPRIHKFLNMAKTTYRPCEFRWIDTSKQIADSLTRLVDHVEKHRTEKTLQIMSATEVKHSFSELIKMYGQNDSIKSAIMKIGSLTQPEQMRLVNSCRAIQTRSKTRKEREEFEEEQIAENMPCFSSTLAPEKIIHIPNDLELTTESSKPIERSTFESTDLDRERLYKELIDNMENVPKTDFEKAQRAHEKWHLQYKVLVSKFGISEKEAKTIVSDCSRCARFPDSSRHVQVPQRKHETPQGPNEVISIDCAHLNECNGYSYLMVTLDSYSRFARIAKLKRLDSKSVYNCLLKLFQHCGFPSVIKCDGAAYFMSAEMKGYMAAHNTLIKSISVGRSNANRVERLILTARNFLERNGLRWSSDKTLYDLNLYLNCCMNIRSSKLYGDVTPYELQNGFIPDLDRFLTCEKPTTDRKPNQSEVRFDKFAAEQNADVHKSQPDKSRFSIGQKVFYRKFGKKSKAMARATIEKIGNETCTLKTERGQLITRHFTDIITKFFTK